MKRAFVGIDAGSVTTKLVVAGEDSSILFQEYLRNEGGPVWALQECFRKLEQKKGNFPVSFVGATGSGRDLAAAVAGADVVKNEISAHARSASHLFPDIGTLIDIGGQDSKIVFFKDGFPVAFNMNTVCAAGTGSFLDHQAMRLKIPIEDFGSWAKRSKNPAKIAGRCGVFAESDLIHKQQLGYKKEDLVAGLCKALATNYLTNVARGRAVEKRVVFQGGVAANEGILRALEERIGLPITVPPCYTVMGAYGAALLAKDRYLSQKESQTKSLFRGVSRISSFSAVTQGFECDLCANSCEIQEILIDGKPVARWGSKCGYWADLMKDPPHTEEVSDTG